MNVTFRARFTNAHLAHTLIIYFTPDRTETWYNSTMPFFGLLYKALKKFLSPTPLNKGEQDQPPPYAEQREHLLKELDELNRKMAAYHANQDRPVYIPDQYR